MRVAGHCVRHGEEEEASKPVLWLPNTDKLRVEDQRPRTYTLCLKAPVSTCCVVGPRLPLSRALERLTIGLGTKSRVGGIKPSSKVESVVIRRYLPTRSVTTVTIGELRTAMLNQCDRRGRIQLLSELGQGLNKLTYIPYSFYKKSWADSERTRAWRGRPPAPPPPFVCIIVWFLKNSL